jgi:hypothetical protein
MVIIGFLWIMNDTIKDNNRILMEINEKGKDLRKREEGREMVTAEEVIKSLPRLLKERPELRWGIYEILSAEFLRRDEFYEYMKRSDERFERLFNELRALREDSNRRFEELNRRFELIDRRFELIDRRFELIDRRFEDLEDWVGVVVGGFQRRAGRNLEDAIAGTLRIALKKDIRPENIRMRERIRDEEGMIGPKGREYEIDLYIWGSAPRPRKPCKGLTNEESLIFEIKSYAEEDDVERFNDKAELAKKRLNLMEAEKVIITLAKHPSFVKFCEERGIVVG